MRMQTESQKKEKILDLKCTISEIKGLLDVPISRLYTTKKTSELDARSTKILQTVENMEKRWKKISCDLQYISTNLRRREYRVAQKVFKEIMQTFSQI